LAQRKLSQKVKSPVGFYMGPQLVDKVAYALNCPQLPVVFVLFLYARSAHTNNDEMKLTQKLVGRNLEKKLFPW